MSSAAREGTAVSASRKRKGGGGAKASKSSRPAENGTTATKGVRASREPPSLERVLLKLALILCSAACFAYVAQPFWSQGKIPGLSFFLGDRVPRAGSSREGQRPHGDTLGGQDSIPGSDAFAAARATRHLRPSLPLVIPVRQVPQEPLRSADQEKLDAVREAFQDSWDAYVDDAFGADEYHPISHAGSNFSEDGGVGYFIVDTIDMLLITENQQGYNQARDWIRDLEWGDKSGNFSVFETTIRTLGGLLSAHALCVAGGDSLSSRTSKLCGEGDAEMFLTKATTLAEHLRPAFTANKLGLPLREVDFMTGRGYADHDNRNMVSLAEVASIQLEFKYLAHATGDDQWWTIAEKPMSAVRAASNASNSDGLLPIFLSPTNGGAMLSEIRLGSRGDSYYEYLIKQFVQTNQSELVYLDMYQKATTGIKRHLLRQSPNRKLLHTAEVHPRLTRGSPQPTFLLVPKQDHLVCFLGGSYMLGALHVQGLQPGGAVRPVSYPPQSSNDFSDVGWEDWSIGHELINTCVDTYTGTKTGLSAEITMFRAINDSYRGKEQDWYIKKPDSQPGRRGAQPREPLIDARNILRPETVESLFIAFHLSGDEIYREWGWQIFQAFLHATRLPGSKAFSGIRDVNAAERDVQHNDRMETFWLAETLKYLYLLFADQDTLRLDQWVLNTEAHPLPIFTPQFATHVL